MGAAVITSVELIFGCICNLWLRMNVWDYSYIPLNLEGQICLLYTVLWAILCVVAIPFSEKVYNKLKTSLGSPKSKNKAVELN